MSTDYQGFREQVREKNDLLSVVQRYGIEVKRAGNVHKALCPFHQEKSASFTIFPDERWKCFGCGKGGDVFDLVAEMDRVEQGEALRILADRAGMKMPQYSPEAEAVRTVQKGALELLKLAADYYHQALISQPKADAHRDYLRERGFGEDVWRQWRLGAAGSGDGLLKYLKAQGADLDLAEKVGLIRRTEQGVIHDFLRERVVIPFLEHNAVIFLTGRGIRPDIQPKYLHLKNSEYAQKTIYNRSARGKALVLVEGSIDVWAVQALAGEGVVAAALMGLGTHDPALKGALKGRDEVLIGLDSDEAGQRKVDELAALVGYERARIVRWGAKDPAEMLQMGIKAGEFREMLRNAPGYLDDLARQIRESGDKVSLVEKAAKVAQQLSPAARDAYGVAIKHAAKGVISAKTINQMVQVPPTPAAAAPAGDALPYYRIEGGEIWRDYGEKKKRVTRGGVARFTQLVNVDDGEASDMELTLKIELAGGREIEGRIAAADSGDPTAVIRELRRLVGPLLSPEAHERTHLVQAMDALSVKMEEVKEVARTGWIESDKGLAFATPGGVIGELPAGWEVALPAEGADLQKFAVVDGGDEAFAAGCEGLIALLKAFQPGLSVPMVAFAILPPAARFMRFHKFALHVSGETGSLKSETSRILQCFYGSGFAKAPPIMNWRSTTNAIEQIGWFLPDVLAVVDDYKPSIVKPWEFTEILHRYADANARMRLDRRAKMKRRQAMRCWMLTNGEDIPTGEASVLARMVLLRLPKRPNGAAYNESLRKASRLSKHFATIQARWVEYLRTQGEDMGLESAVELYHQEIAAHIQKVELDVPNVNRIALNVAVLRAVWEKFGEWLLGLLPEGLQGEFFPFWDGFGDLSLRLGAACAKLTVEEKPSRVFLSALQEGIDSGRYQMMSREATLPANRSSVIAFRDGEGVYVLPSAYSDVAEWMRRSGQQIGFSRQELYRLLEQDGIMVTPGTRVIRVGNPSISIRALHLKPGILGNDDV